jgi:hypothetical protein
MNINPEHQTDGEKLDAKFAVLDSVLHLPEPHAKKWALLISKISDQLDAFAKTKKKLPPVNCNWHADSMDDLVRYVAFQGLQIHNLQEEMRILYEGLDHFAQIVDRKQDKHDHLLN